MMTQDIIKVFSTKLNSCWAIIITIEWYTKSKQKKKEIIIMQKALPERY